MIIKKVKYIFYLLAIVILTFQVFFHLRLSNFKELSETIEGITIQTTLLKQNIISTYENSGYNILGCEISFGSEEADIKPICEYISYPCLVIYIKYSEEICMSCIDFAINKVRFHFSDFDKNSNICIISTKYNPSFISRVYQKKIFYLSGNKRLGIPADNKDAPNYFIINEKNEITSFFTPNIVYQDLVDAYLSHFKNLISGEN